MSGPTPRFLLDKNVIRRLGMGLLLLDKAGPEEQFTVALWLRLRQAGYRLYMSTETAHLLQQFSTYREVGLIQLTLGVLEAGRYFKRWAHRLREHGFTREDAKILSMGTFGTDAGGTILGVLAVVTFDQRLLNNYQQQRPLLERRLTAMTNSLPQPYTEAMLPEVRHPTELWAVTSTPSVP